MGPPSGPLRHNQKQTELTKEHLFGEQIEGNSGQSTCLFMMLKMLGFSKDGFSNF